MAIRLKMPIKRLRKRKARKEEPFEPQDDIGKQNPLDADIEDGKRTFRFSSIIEHIKKNWSDIKFFKKI